MKNLQNKVAVVTGAGSGIGRELAIELAGHGCHLAISDVNEKGLEETAQMLNETRGKITTYLLDVADKDAVHAHAEDVKRDHGHVDIVINNAGVAIGCNLDTVEYGDFEWLMNINFWGTIYGTRAFLPLLKERKDSNLVNISSIYGIMPSPLTGPYVCSKFAVRGYTENLMIELKDTNVNISVVHPGGIKTGIAKNARHLIEDEVPREHINKVYEDNFRTTAKKAAQVIVKGLRKNRQRIMVGTDAKIIDWFRRLFPMISMRLIGNISLKLLKG